MVLDLGAGSLFKNSGLQQDTGLLKGRWGQDGSNRRDVSVSYANTDGTILTVTAGKVFYLQSLSYSTNYNAAGTNQGQIKDGGTGGTVKIYLACLPLNQMFPIVFDPPIAFTTDVFHEFINTGLVGEGTWIYNVTGWEEDAP